MLIKFVFFRSDLQQQQMAMQSVQQQNLLPTQNVQLLVPPVNLNVNPTGDMSQFGSALGQILNTPLISQGQDSGQLSQISTSVVQLTEDEKNQVQSAFFGKLNQQQLENVRRGLLTGNLSQFTLDELQQICLAVQAGCFVQLNSDQLKHLENAVQLASVVDTSQAVTSQIQVPAPAGDTVAMNRQQVFVSPTDPVQIITPDQVARISGSQLATTGQLNPYAVKQSDGSSQFAQANMLVPQAVFGQREQISHIVITKANGSRKEFLVNENHANELSCMVEQADISNQSAQSSSTAALPNVSQPFPAHTLRHANLSQMQLLQRRQQGMQNMFDLHSDTSSSIGSGARSIRSAGSAGTVTTFTGSDTTR